MSPAGEGDEKVEALRRHRALNPSPDLVTDSRFRAGGFFDPRDLIQVKYEMVRCAQAGASVSAAAAAHGLSRPTFYHAQAALASEGLAGLVPRRTGPKGGHKLTNNVMEFVQQVRAASPGANSKELARRVREQFGVSVHPRSIERALRRQGEKLSTPRR
jgi:transposase